MSGGYTKGQKTAIYNLRAKKDTISIQADKGTKDAIREHVKKTGESMNSFINRAIKETLERESGK